MVLMIPNIQDRILHLTTGYSSYLGLQRMLKLFIHDLPLQSTHNLEAEWSNSLIHAQLILPTLRSEYLQSSKYYFDQIHFLFKIMDDLDLNLASFPYSIQQFSLNLFQISLKQCFDSLVNLEKFLSYLTCHLFLLQVVLK